jgi:hypothetical protein
MFMEGALMTTLTTVSAVLGAGRTVKTRRARARLAPGGQDRAREQDQARGRGTRSAQNPPADETAHWQRILDLLDPGKRCGEWSAMTFAGRPVVCTRAPHDMCEQHSDAKTGWRWYGDTSASGVKD